jgi:DNA adenine methylase/adenine-specific DNA-methyltransferase
MGQQAATEQQTGPRPTLAYSRQPIPLPQQAASYPELRYMGSKRRLLPWIHDVLAPLQFNSALDPFSGSGCVGYLMKGMGKRVVATDFLNFSSTLAKATIENNRHHLDGPAIKALLRVRRSAAPGFVERTFAGVFYTLDDLRFIDRVSLNIFRLPNAYQQSLARAALIRSCLKRQPRGVFTVSGDLSKYDDGRRDLRLSIEEHFLEQIEVFNSVVFDNGKRNYARRNDVFNCRTANIDLVYLDPPYVPRSDDNCYIKRYHFLEGLSCYWQGVEIDYATKVKKIVKRYTPFSYRRTAIKAFDRTFWKFQHQTIVLSYSSNGYPDLDVLLGLMERYKRKVTVHRRPHRYHFGTHSGVARALVDEYLIVGE